MARHRELKNNYTSGEVDPFMLGRADSKHYFNGAEKMRNVVVLPQGGYRPRPGSALVDELPNVIEDAGRSDTVETVNYSTGSTHFDRSFALTTGRTVTHVGVYLMDESATVKIKIGKRNSAGNYDVAHTQDVTHGGGGWQLFALTSPFVVPAGTYYVGAFISGSASRGVTSVSSAVKAGNVTGLAQSGFTEASVDIPLLRVRYSSATGAEISDTRLIPFQFSTLQHYLVMAVDGGFRIYMGGEFITAETAEQWRDSELSEIGWTQSLDTLLIFHENRRPRAVLREGSDTDWASEFWELKNIPLFEFPGTVYTNGVDEVQTIEFSNFDEGNPYTLTLGGEETEVISYTAVEATHELAIQNALRDLADTSDDGITVVANSSTEFTVTFGGDDGQKPWGGMIGLVKAGLAAGGLTIEVNVTTKGEFPGEDVWSDARGWPRCGTFDAGGRLWMAGSSERPQTGWASRAGDPNDFNAKRTDADFGIDFTINADTVSSIHQVFVGRHLQFFTSSGEFYVPVSASEPITPDNMALRRTTARGIKRGLPVFDLEGATVFVQPERRTDEDNYQRGVTLREFVFSDGEQAYNANNISLLCANLIRDPRRVAVRRAVTDNDADLLLLPNADDGTMTTLCSLRSQEVNGFTLFETLGNYVDVGVDGDDIYTVVRREIDGVERGFLEVLVEGLQVDCGVYDFDVSAPVDEVEVPHLIGETVWVKVDGVWRDDVEVPGSGVVTLDPPAEESYQVGLPWPVVDEVTGNVWQVSDLPIAAETDSGVTTGKKRRLVSAAFQLLRTRTFLVNGNRFTKRPADEDMLETPHPQFTGEWKKKGLLGWQRGGRMWVGDTRPDEVNMLACTKEVGV